MHAGVAKYVERLQACKASGTQTRLDAFFASKGPKAVAQGDKFDPFAKKQKKAAAGASSSIRASLQSISFTPHSHVSR